MAKTAATKHRKYVSGATLSLGGIMEVIGDLVTPRVSGADKEEKFVSLCPECGPDAPAKVNQFYSCEHKHGPYSIGEVLKGKQNEDESWVVMTKAQADEARKSDLPEKQLNIQVHRRSDVSGEFQESGNTYIFLPSGPSKLYGILLDWLDNHGDEYVLCGLINLRGVDNFMTVTRGVNGNLVLQQVVWPEDMKEFGSPDYEVDEKLSTLAGEFIEKAITDYEPEAYRKESRDRIKTLVSTVAAGQPVPAPKAKAKDDSEDLMAALESALAQQKAS